MPVFLCKVNGFLSMASTCYLCLVLPSPFLLTWIPIRPSLFLGVQYASRMSVMEAVVRGFYHQEDAVPSLQPGPSCEG